MFTSKQQTTSKHNKIEISDLTLNSATIYWTWPKTATFAENNNKYLIKLTREDNKWKIAYMDGFDFNSFFSKPIN